MKMFLSSVKLNSQIKYKFPFKTLISVTFSLSEQLLVKNIYFQALLVQMKINDKLITIPSRVLTALLMYHFYIVYLLKSLEVRSRLFMIMSRDLKELTFFKEGRHTNLRKQRYTNRYISVLIMSKCFFPPSFGHINSHPFPGL